MKKNEKETAILIAVCAFISLLILSPFIFFILSNESKTETVYSNYMTIKDKYKKVKPADYDSRLVCERIESVRLTYGYQEP